MPKPPLEEVIGVWEIPLGGVNQQISAYTRTPTLRDGLNIVVQSGYVRPRPGILQFDANVFLARPTGALQYVSAGGTRVPIVMTTNRIWKYDSGAWTDIIDTVLTATADQPGRMAVLEFGTPGDVWLVATNGNDVPRKWKYGDAQVSQIAGTPPKWTDVTSTFDRIVGIVPPYEISWGEPLSLATWPANNRRFLADTPDQLVAIRKQGTLGMIVYKENSIWMGSAYGGTSAQAFRFDFLGWYDGPASPNAVVDVDGLQVYMTPQGRIGAFGSSGHRWVADGIWPAIRAEIDPTTSKRVFGVYERALARVLFFYPRTGDNGECFGAAILHLPFVSAGIEAPFATPGRLLTAVSAGMDMRLSDLKDRVLLFSSTSLAQKSYTWEGTQDAGTNFTGFWQTNLVPMKGLNVYRATGLEVLAQRGAGNGSMTAKLVTSSLQETESGTVGSGLTLDLTTTPIRDLKGFDARSRHFGLRFEFTSNAVVRVAGAILSGILVDAV